jgi:hypothetical protein
MLEELEKSLEVHPDNPFLMGHVQALRAIKQDEERDIQMKTETITYRKLQTASNTPTELYGEITQPILQEILSACNATIERCVREGKTLLNLDGMIQTGNIHLIAKACENDTPKDVALRFLDGEVFVALTETTE